MSDNNNAQKKIFYAGGFLYNPKTDSVLLHKRDAQTNIHPNQWAFFGGTSEPGETPQQTFAREMSEELGIEIAPERIEPLCDYLNEEMGTYRYVFVVESDLGKDQMQLSEGEDFDWVSLREVFEYDLTEKTARDLRTFLNLKPNT
ncbi:MAG: NUDIX hydrolase [Candidatus Spechtbacterales bacterium]